MPLDFIPPYIQRMLLQAHYSAAMQALSSKPHGRWAFAPTAKVPLEYESLARVGLVTINGQEANADGLLDCERILELTPTGMQCVELLEPMAVARTLSVEFSFLSTLEIYRSYGVMLRSASEKSEQLVAH